MALLEVNDINVYYGSIHAIKSVSFEVNEGEIISLIGLTVLVNQLFLNYFGLLRSNTGSIVFDGKDIFKFLPIKLFI